MWKLTKNLLFSHYIPHISVTISPLGVRHTTRHLDLRFWATRPGLAFVVFTLPGEQWHQGSGPNNSWICRFFPPWDPVLLNKSIEKRKRVDFKRNLLKIHQRKHGCLFLLKIQLEEGKLCICSFQSLVYIPPGQPLAACDEPARSSIWNLWRLLSNSWGHPGHVEMMGRAVWSDELWSQDWHWLFRYRERVMIYCASVIDISMYAYAVI